MTRSKGLRKFIIIILAELAVLAAVVWFFDPFYQYHEPLGGMKAVLNDRDNQVVGTIRNFEYDSVLVGSSVAENFDSEYLNQYYDCTTLKIIRASGSAADLRYYLDMAHENQKLKNVFWCLDIFALNAPLQVTLYDEGIPRYLHTASVLDDIPYVWNKEILFEKIPFMLAAGLQGKNTGGQAYDWSEDKVFGPEKAMQAYQKPKEYLPSPQDVEEYKEIIAANIALLKEEIEAHPQVQYRFLLPPYSLLWWDCGEVNGQTETRLYIVEQVLPALLEYENVEVYDYQNDMEIVCNLDYYMDMIHYSPDINQIMLERMVSGEDKVTPENWEDTVVEKRAMVKAIINEEIYRYYER